MTHCDRLLAALSDGQWHDHHSLYALRMIVHSRIADLRRRGHVIEQRRDGDLFLYRLAGLDDTHGPHERDPQPGRAEALAVGVVEPAPATPSPHDGGGLGTLDEAHAAAVGLFERVPDCGVGASLPKPGDTLEPSAQLTLDLGRAA